MPFEEYSLQEILSLLLLEEQLLMEVVAVVVLVAVVANLDLVV